MAGDPLAEERTATPQTGPGAGLPDHLGSLVGDQLDPHAAVGGGATEFFNYAQTNALKGWNVDLGVLLRYPRVNVGIRYRLRAEVDDMALLRLLARDSDSVALVPSVVVRDELLSRRLVEYAVVPELSESFYAISVRRHFEPPLLKSLLAQTEAAVLAPAPT